ncbi:hypothetical protein GGI02_004829 [Coemansia sp. RSA 2322]|uniref:Uncharacterized protein n=1 Tax=Coemansia thaxteri TaxID=2663907 RepID=A0A9W8BG08_9FUNG|nr:hypothetical protein H4R26_001423 [Coemansia thaxteri]KAJ2464987.1 hypothetical protein GGI02_004829 [Coemansia sp. RSA 2322]
MAEDRQLIEKLRRDMAEDRQFIEKLRRDMAEDRQLTEKLRKDMAEDRQFIEKLRRDMVEDRQLIEKLRRDMAEDRLDIEKLKCAADRFDLVIAEMGAQIESLKETVRVRDGAERLYSKYGLALFEVLGKDLSSGTPGVEKHDEGPVAAVLRRRWRKDEDKGEPLLTAKSTPIIEGAAETKDTSNEHYRKLNRKPEYTEQQVQ